MCYGPVGYSLDALLIRVAATFECLIVPVIVFLVLRGIRHNSTLGELYISDNPISAPVCKSVELELVLCRLRNAQVTEIEASGYGFDDADATRIAEALRCEIVCLCWCGRMRLSW